MFATVLLLACSWQSPMGNANVMLMQTYPPRRGSSSLCRSSGQKQAVILVQGLELRDDGASPAQPRFQSWQGSTSTLVRRLCRHADVYSVCYAQTRCAEDVAWYPGFRRAVGTVKSLGYERVILLGHSAGGLVARHYVEDFPGSDVSMVIQVATPNGGAGLADWGVKLAQSPKGQHEFIASLRPHHRLTLASSRRLRKIPAHVDFVVLAVAKSCAARSDGVVSCKSQWTRDLQLQRVPCICVEAKHGQVMYDSDCIDIMSSLVRTPQPRWGRRQVFLMRRQLGFQTK